MPAARSHAVIVLAGLALLLAACGDGAEQPPREGGNDPAVGSAELAELEFAIARLDARISKLEDAVDELTALVGGDSAALGDLPDLVDELRLSSALLDVALRRLDALEASAADEDPCAVIGLPFCPENPLRNRPREEW